MSSSVKAKKTEKSLKRYAKEKEAKTKKKEERAKKPSKIGGVHPGYTWLQLLINTNQEPYEELRTEFAKVIRDIMTNPIEYLMLSKYKPEATWNGIEQIETDGGKFELQDITGWLHTHIYIKVTHKTWILGDGRRTRERIAELAPTMLSPKPMVDFTLVENSEDCMRRYVNKGVDLEKGADLVHSAADQK